MIYGLVDGGGMKIEGLLLRFSGAQLIAWCQKQADTAHALYVRTRQELETCPKESPRRDILGTREIQAMDRKDRYTLFAQHIVPDAEYFLSEDDLEGFGVRTRIGPE